MKSNIEHIQQMLDLHHRDKSVIMETAIMNRLNKSLFTYSDELDKGLTYMSYKSELNVLKKL